MLFKVTAFPLTAKHKENRLCFDKAEQKPVVKQRSSFKEVAYLKHRGWEDAGEGGAGLNMLEAKRGIKERERQSE